MKARLENNEIRIYGDLPSKYKSDTLNVAGGFNELPDEIHESEGFFPVIITGYDSLLFRLGELYFDPDERVYKYALVSTGITVEKLKADFFDRFDEVQDEFERLISRCERIYGREDEGLNAAIAQIVAIQAKTVADVKAFTTIEEMRNYSIREQDVEYLKSLLDPYKF